MGSTEIGEISAPYRQSLGVMLGCFDGGGGNFGGQADLFMDPPSNIEAGRDIPVSFSTPEPLHLLPGPAIIAIVAYFGLSYFGRDTKYSTVASGPSNAIIFSSRTP